MMKRIEIRFFRGIESLDIDVKRFNMFVGENGAGKTSIISAIRFALTGKYQKDDIKHGHSSAGVRIIFEDGSYFTRYLSQTGVSAACNGKKTTLKSLNEYIEMKLGMKMNVINMMLGEEYYTNVNMSSLLMSLIPIQVNKESFIKIAEYIKQSALTKAELYVINRYFGDIITADDLDKAENTIKAERTVYNRSIKQITALLKTYPEETPKYSREELEKMLAETSYQEIYKIKLQEYTNAVNMNNTAKAKKKAKEDELEKYKNLPVLNMEEANQKEVRISELEQGILELQKNIASTGSNNDLIIKTLDALNTSICPISNKLICSTDKTPLKKELEEQKAVNEAVIKDNLEKIEDHKKTISELKDSLLKMRELSDKLKIKERLEQEIKEMGENLPVVPEKPKAPESLGLTKDEIMKQMHIWEIMKDKEVKTAELDNLQRRIVLLNYVLELIKPENAKTEIVKRIIDPVEKMINEKAEKIGFSIKILPASKGAEIYLETKTGIINISRCSSGEFVDVVYLIMSTISSINNANILVLDNLDKLDNGALERLVAALENDTQFKYIFIAGIHSVPGRDGIMDLTVG